MKKNIKRAAVIATGWMGDSIACTAAASSLNDLGYQVDLFIRWPQIQPILKNDSRFKTVLYGKWLSHKIQRPLFPSSYDLIVKAPLAWTYNEPFTAEIRRLAGCEPKTEYQLFLSDRQKQLKQSDHQRPIIAIGRDLYKRNFGRHIDDFIRDLSKFAEIQWVGLDPSKNSKHGKGSNLIDDASTIYNADIFVGPESGLLWLAAGLGKTCLYFTENILHVAKRAQRGNPSIALGSVNHFPNGPHVALPAYCSNDEAILLIREKLSSIN